jgi:hypothetical protein
VKSQRIPLYKKLIWILSTWSLSNQYKAANTSHTKHHARPSGFQQTLKGRIWQFDQPSIA